ncbi:AraC family transcriptional regulator [Vallitalea pronyensis]|uniref:AraC family transcriptional regulator n=1 Tax=Vallitalea pronyensis TaxID=1348613 RepID=A0A8J8SIX3_9FIRM|nr:helix-turn-helix domain-containing protein [Vallitalea pronyensis]QUI25375.1 AraC family transcriptional regulator [Vallitalea pronyensis]
MSRWYNKMSYYYKYLFSYLLLLVIPLLVIGIYVDANLLDTLEKEVLTNELNALYQVKESFDTDMLQLSKISNAIFLETFESTTRFADDPLRYVELIEDMNILAITNPLIQEMFYYYKEDNYVISSTGSIPVDLFFNKYFDFDAWDRKAFMDKVKNIEKPFVRPKETIRSIESMAYEAVTYFFPLNRTTGKYYGAVFFTVPGPLVEEKLQSIMNINNKFTFVLDADNNRIASSPGGEALIMNEFQNFMGIDIKEDAMYTDDRIVINGVWYYAVLIQSNETGWKFITLTPESSISEKVKDLKWGFLLGLCLIACLGVAFIFLAMRINYSPIKRLKSFSQSISQDTIEDSGELEVIRRSLDYLSSQNTLLSDAVALSSKASRQLLIMELLRGVQPKEQILYEMAERYNIEVDKGCMVATIHINRDYQLSEARGEVIASAREVLEESVSVYECQQLDCWKITLLINLEEQDYPAVLESLQQLQIELREDSNLSTAIGLSNLHESIDFAPKAFLEASTAIDYRLVKGNDNVISYDNIVIKEASLSTYPKENLMKISTYLMAGDIIAIKKELDSIIHYIKHQNTPIFVVRGLCFDIINLIYHASENMLKAFDDTELDIPDAFTLSDYDTVDDLVNIVIVMSRDLCERIIKQKDKEELGLIHDMVNYIMCNYTDTEFSLAGMADHFGMYQSALSAYFKDKTDQTILNYVTRIKMQRATELLETTDMNMNKIAWAVGYSNTNSFIRRFKQWHNITPGEYRKQHKS